MKHEVNYFRVSILGFAVFTILLVFHHNDGDTGKHNHASSSSGRVRRSVPSEQVVYPVLCPEVKPISTFEEVKGWEDWNVDKTFYQKYAGIPNLEIPVFGSDKVSDTSIQEAYNLAVRLTGHLQADVLNIILEKKIRVVVLADEEKPLQIPEYMNGQPEAAAKILITTEPNLLCLYKDPNRGESLLVRSLAESVREQFEQIDPTFRRSLKTMFSDAVHKELYTDNEEINSPASYWTESVKNYFGANLAAYKICTKSGLQEYDPDIEKTVRAVFGETPYVHVCPLIDGMGKLEGCKNVAVRKEPPPLMAAKIDTPVEEVQAPRGHAHLERDAADEVNEVNVKSDENPTTEPTRRDCGIGEVKCVGEDNPTMYLDCIEVGKWSFKETPPGLACQKDESGVSHLVPLTPRRAPRDERG